MTAAFWVIGPVITAAALGIVLVRTAVHAALLLAVVMVGLAMLYASLDAPFLFAVQLVVYTGAVLMLFLFVLMLVGSGADEPRLVRRGLPLRGIAGWLAGAGVAAVLVVGVVQASLGTMKGLAGTAPRGDVQALADLIFGRYVLAFEATSALLVTAAVAAMVLTHQQRLEPRRTQAQVARDRITDFMVRGTHPGNLPAPGTTSLHNSADTPALLPDGRPSALSVPTRLRGEMHLELPGEVPELPREHAPSPAGNGEARDE
jgi:NADH-quinone oxidoreductase subunit J